MTVREIVAAAWRRNGFTDKQVEEALAWADQCNPLAFRITEKQVSMRDGMTEEKLIQMLADEFKNPGKFIELGNQAEERMRNRAKNN